MKLLQQSVIVLLFISLGSIYAAQAGWLGPYGGIGDTYHLIILVSTLFFTYMILSYTVLRRKKSL